MREPGATGQPMGATGPVPDSEAEEFAEAIVFYLEHPEAIHDDFLKAFMDGARIRVERLVKEQDAAEEAAKAAPLSISSLIQIIVSCLVGI